MDGTHTHTLTSVEVVLELLNHGIEQLPGLQLVLAGSASAATGGRCVEQSHTGGQGLPQLSVQPLYLVPLEGLELRDLLHVSKGEEEGRDRQRHALVTG